MRLHRALAVASLFAGALSSGCYRMTIRSGRAEAPGSPATNGVSRGGYLNGIVEDQPMVVYSLCRSGWASVYIETEFINGFLNSLRGLIYHTENITLRCTPEAGAVIAPQQPVAPSSAPAPAPTTTAPPGETKL